jgi:phosphoserine phosphatase
VPAPTGRPPLRCDLVLRGLVCFDVDGTLVPGTSSSQYLAGFLGHLEALRSAEEAYALGSLSNQDVSIIDARGWRGHHRGEIAAWLDGLPLVDGITDVVAWCVRHDLTPILTTLAWEPVGAFLCERFDFASACGPRLAIEDGRYSGEVAAHLDEFGKRDFALALAAKYNVDLGHCAAVGDSRSDEPLFAVVGLGVAFNGSARLRELAGASVEGEDIRAVLPALDQWLTATPR